MVDEAKIDSLVKAAVLAELDGVEFIQDFDYATLCREYNGIGPEWAGETVRGKLTERLALFEPAALIHDMRNYRSDGTRFGFNYANFEFWGNCVKLVKDAYPWWTWKHWRARAAARLAFDFVQGPGGWKAWQDCHERTQRKEPQMKKTLKSLFETGVLHLVVLCLIFALALVVSGCSVTKVNYERDEKGVVSYRLYRNDHWLKTSGTGISGGMTKDGKFEFAAEGLERSPSEEFNRTMMTYTSAFIQLAQIAAAAYNPSASMAAAKSESSKAGSSTIVLEAPKAETQPDQVVAPKAETQPGQGWIMLTGAQSSTGNNAASDPHAAECTDGSCTTGACTDGSCNR